jgi:zinc protease
MSRRLRVSFAVLLLAFLASLVPGAPGRFGLAAARPPQATAAAERMPVDPAITVGRYANGLKYYVRKNAKPEKRAELRLVVKAGSVLEDDDQLGLAHMVEHMAFNGTAHFPKNEIVQFIESLGMRFGADLNASTSFDETIYMLQVPTDKSEVIDRALLILEDWAHGVTFDPAEIDKERGVVMEEWRMGRGAGARMSDKLFPLLLKGSRYADRLPIGKPEIIQNFKPDTLKRFYRDWYRPDLMAVVAVGDFDQPAVEGLVKNHFGSLAPAKSPRPRPVFDVPDHAGTVYGTVTDKEMTGTTIEIDNLMRSREEGSVDVYRQKTVDRLFSSLLNARFSDLAQKPDAPFVMAFAGRGGFVARTKDDASLSAMVKDNGVERGLEALLVEVERVARFGFTQTELDRQKAAVLRSYEQMATEQNNRVSSARAAEYIRNFLRDETLPSPGDELALHKRFLPQIALADVNRIAREWFTPNNRVVILTAPEKPGLVIPDQAKLEAVMNAAAAKELAPYVDTAAGAALMTSLPVPGRVTKATTRDAVGITEWELSNGARVVLKPTTFKEDEILFRAYRSGGTSLVSDADYPAVSSASSLVGLGGIGSMSAIDYRKFMTGKVASAGASIDEFEEGLSGSSSKRDLETMFQLVYLRFTAPRADPAAVGAQKDRMKTLLANQTASPDYAFGAALNDAMYQGHPRRQMITAATVDQWDLDKSMAFYKQRFADASGFTFLFVGSFDPEAMKPLVERYLGSLPALNRNDTWKDIGVPLPKGVVKRTVEKGLEPKSQVEIAFTGPFEYVQAERVAIRAMADILSTRLLETIREDLGGTYSIGASQSYSKIPRSEFSVTIDFGCDPKRTDELIARVFAEIEKLKTEGPTDKQLNDVREALIKTYESNMKLNSYLIGQLKFKYQYGDDPAMLWEIAPYYRALTKQTIQTAATKYLDPKAYVQVVLMPEKK